MRWQSHTCNDDGEKKQVKSILIRSFQGMNMVQGQGARCTMQDTIVLVMVKRETRNRETRRTPGDSKVSVHTSVNLD
jgi:hypothetical protein